MQTAPRFNCFCTSANRCISNVKQHDLNRCNCYVSSCKKHFNSTSAGVFVCLNGNYLNFGQQIHSNEKMTWIVESTWNVLTWCHFTEQTKKKTWSKKIHLHIILHNISKRIFVIRLGRRWAFVRCQQRLNTKSTNQKFMQHVKAKRSQGRRIKRRTIIETTNVGYFSWIVHAQIKKNTLNADATV